MKPNIGIVNALLRITVGLTMLSWITSKMVWRPYRESYIFWAMCGAMKVAEGIVRFCPLTALYEQYQKQEARQNITLEDEEINSTPINPS